jgi:hypothetical protein
MGRSDALFITVLLLCYLAGLHVSSVVADIGATCRQLTCCAAWDTVLLFLQATQSTAAVAHQLHGSKSWCAVNGTVHYTPSCACSSSPGVQCVCLSRVPVVQLTCACKAHRCRSLRLYRASDQLSQQPDWASRGCWHAGAGCGSGRASLLPVCCLGVRVCWSAFLAALCLVQQGGCSLGPVICFVGPYHILSQV